MVTVAFQFPFEDHDLQEDIAAMAREYIRHVMSCVKNLSQEAMILAPNPEMISIVANPAMGFNSTSASTFAFNLAILMCQSYRQVKEPFIFSVFCKIKVMINELLFYTI